MTKRRAPVVTYKHLQLLRSFGRSKSAREAEADKKEALWKVVCRTGGASYIPFDQVEEAWRETQTGRSQDTRIAVCAEVDPEYTLVGIAYQGNMVCSHTSKTSVLLRRILNIHRDTFDSEEAFLESVRQEALSLDKPKKKKRRPRE